MAKWAIINKDNGTLTDICDAADKFEIYEGADAAFKWCEVPDDTTYDHAMINGVIVHKSDNEDLRTLAIVERGIAYGPVGDDIKILTNTISRQVDDIGKLIDEFSSFARMPEPEIKLDNLSRCLNESYMLFANSHKNIKFNIKKEKQKQKLPKIIKIM